jgi:hypothetical protein
MQNYEVKLGIYKSKVQGTPETPEGFLKWSNFSKRSGEIY